MSAKISKMYKQSGGCCAEHNCCDCSYLSIGDIKRKKIILICEKYKEICKEEAAWKFSYVACKFFERREENERPTKNR